MGLTRELMGYSHKAGNSGFHVGTQFANVLFKNS
jgi:hypothetical protein